MSEQPTTTPIRVCVVDDQTLVREGITGLLALADDVVVVGEAADGDEALRVVASTSPDVVLLDLQMPGLDGLGVLARLGERADPPPVLVLTTFDDDELVLRALALGARGYLLKDVSLDGLLHGVRTLAAGGTLVQPAVTDRLLTALRRRDPEAESPLATPDLTPRELEVLRLVAGGFANREIAEVLHLAEGTVKNHVSSVLAKLGVTDRTRAVLRALRMGLLEPPSAS